jgi:hypothetical protein
VGFSILDLRLDEAGAAQSVRAVARRTSLTPLAKLGATVEAAGAAAILPELHSAAAVEVGPLASRFSV